jgi:hypothetical protein
MGGPYSTLEEVMTLMYIIIIERVGAVVVKSSVVWDITPCSALNVNRRFGGTCRLHLQGRRISKQEISENQVASRATNYMALYATRQNTL